MLADRLGGMLAEAVPALNPDRTAEGLAVVEQALQDAQRHNTLSLGRIRSVRDRVAGRGSSARHPWRAGQQLARDLRRDLRLDGEPLPTMARLGEALEETTVDAATKRTPVDGGGAILVDGVVACGEGGRPAFAFRPRGEPGRRFHFCRALAELLWRPGVNALLTKARTERQQSNRAFAAEFLAPSAALRDRTRRTTVDEDDVDELATEFGVSSMVIEHQLANHQIARLPAGRR